MCGFLARFIASNQVLWRLYRCHHAMAAFLRSPWRPSCTTGVSPGIQCPGFCAHAVYRGGSLRHERGGVRYAVHAVGGAVIVVDKRGLAHAACSTARTSSTASSAASAALKGRIHFERAL